jgi:hypothetical protein
MSAILLHAAERFCLRRKVDIPCQVVSENDFALLSERCLDLSMRGLSAHALRHASGGTAVIVSLRIPNSSVWLDMEGVIARIAWGRRDLDDLPVFGIRFTSVLPAVESAVLAARLSGMPPPVPRRGLRVDYAASVRRIATAA